MRKASHPRGARRPAPAAPLSGLALCLVGATAAAAPPAAVPVASVTVPLGAVRALPPGVAAVTTYAYNNAGKPPAAALPALPAAAPAMPSLAPPLTAPDTATARPLQLSLATPVEDCNITSPFGWRIHPILKVRRFHQGVDYGAAEGTPVHASADGVIEEMGRRGHYGLYLRIRHSGTVQTAYAHLEHFAAGLSVGSTVQRGEVVANVGHTGWATGSHLYYEVIVDGRKVDPRHPGLQVRVDQREPLAQASSATTGGMP